MSYDEQTLIGGVEQRPIRLVEYDPRWCAIYQHHARTIVTALGERALGVHHVGSTAVPELAAKPIVDVLLVVANSADEASYLPALEAANYKLRVREPAFHEHRMLRTNERDVHLHVFSVASPEVGRMIAFRNRLRNHRTDRQLYENTKRQLAGQAWPDMNAYADAKTAVIERILATAANDR